VHCIVTAALSASVAANPAKSAPKPKQGDGSLKPPERLDPEEVKRRLREWLKSEKDK